MKRCKNCIMPDTKPTKFKGELCPQCESHLNPHKEPVRILKELCDERRGQKPYDCAIAVSGGKDSYFQVHIMKKEFNMNPLLITVEPITWTDEGRFNLQNLGERLGCDIITFSLDKNKQRELTRMDFEQRGEPMRWWNAMTLNKPQEIAEKFGIKLVFYGEDDPFLMEKYSTIPVFLEKYMPWDRHDHYQQALKYGFKTLDYKRQGYIDNYSAIDSYAYLVNLWLKYPKFGYQRATELACDRIRDGRLTRNEALALARDYDHVLDEKILDDFLNFTRYSREEFYELIDKFWNRELFSKENLDWALKKEVVYP